jgi:hypothetical protein
MGKKRKPMCIECLYFTVGATNYCRFWNITIENPYQIICEEGLIFETESFNEDGMITHGIKDWPWYP